MGRGGHTRRGRGGTGTRGGQGLRAGTEGEQGEQVRPNVGYATPDNGNVLPPFTPSRPPGSHFDRVIMRGAMTTELEFFHLFITTEMIAAVASHTNSYAHAKVGTQGYTRNYVSQDGSWVETSPEEIDRLVALLVYMGLVRRDMHVEKYWSTKTLYHGLWARKILSRDRYKALMTFLHVVDPANETPGHRLRKVDTFVSAFKERCMLLYQPSQHMSVDERMVKSKHRSGIRQYMKDKPTKWGIKLWVLADSDNGYTVDFNIYIGKNAAETPSKHGFGYSKFSQDLFPNQRECILHILFVFHNRYDVVMKLMAPYLDQRYHLYLDNFYTPLS